MNWTPALEAYYLELYRRVEPTPSAKGFAEHWANTLHDEENEARYRWVSKHVGEARFGFWPWWFIAILHELEASSKFDRFLCNGDTLPGPTTSAPLGLGPFEKWEDAAVESLQVHARAVGRPPWYADPIKEPTIAEALYVAERWNGFGYLIHHQAVPSPYLWGRTNMHHRGKYVVDGKFDAMAETKQIGFVAYLDAVCRTGIPGVVGDEPTLACVDEEGEPWRPPILKSALESMEHGQNYETVLFQRFMNEIAPEETPSLVADGIIGPKTRRRYLMVFGTALQ